MPNNIIFNQSASELKTQIYGVNGSNIMPISVDGTGQLQVSTVTAVINSTVTAIVDHGTVTALLGTVTAIVDSGTITAIVDAGTITAFVGNTVTAIVDHGTVTALVGSTVTAIVDHGTVTALLGTVTAIVDSGTITAIVDHGTVTALLGTVTAIVDSGTITAIVDHGTVTALLGTVTAIVDHGTITALVGNTVTAAVQGMFTETSTSIANFQGTTITALTMDTSQQKMYSFYVLNNSVNTATAFLQISPLGTEGYYYNDSASAQLLPNGKAVLVAEKFLKFTRLMIQAGSAATVSAEVYYNSQT
ncbi:MAG TPA: DUF6385 domain-containing protein [Clostridia bacterium]|nr:DUF6385 domain-containing protein [Clostridia bacterium]